MSGGQAQAQSPGDFSVTYGPNYSSADRKDTMKPSWVAPLAVLYRINCRYMVGADDDTFLVNKTTPGYQWGHGDPAVEGHITLWNGGVGLYGKCLESIRPSLRFDDVITIPVSGTLESTKVVNQSKLTFLRPTITALGQQLATLTVVAGASVAGVSSGGTTANALGSANYTRNFHPDGAWAWESEVDLASANALSPSSAAVLFAIDGSLNQSQTWLIRFGTSMGLTPYAPKVSPFVQFIFSKNLTPSAPASGPGGSGIMRRRMR
jgi:hypothetical protein